MSSDRYETGNRKKEKWGGREGNERAKRRNLRGQRRRKIVKLVSFHFYFDRNSALLALHWELARGDWRTTKSRLSCLPRDSGNRTDCQVITGPQCDFSSATLAKVSEYLISAFVML